MKMLTFATLSCIFVANVLSSCMTRVKGEVLPPLPPESGMLTYIHAPGKIAQNQDNVTGSVYVIAADGMNSRPITRSNMDATEPGWSHDGTRIAFGGCLNHPGKAYYIYVVNADGTNLHRITERHDCVGSPTWSPDDKEIAYDCSDVGTKPSIHIVGCDGKNDRKINWRCHPETYPCWSPDGKHLLFHTLEQGTDWDIAIMNTDGSEAHKLTHGQDTDWIPAYSPEGSKIAFWSMRSGNWEIFTMNVDGTAIKQLTHENGQTGLDISRPAWSPGGQYIAYTSCRNPGKMDIILMDMQGRERLLTSGTGNNVAPSWTAVHK